MEKFTKTNVTELRLKLQKVLDDSGLASDNNLKLNIGDARFSSNSVNFKLETTISGEKTLKEARQDRKADVAVYALARAAFQDNLDTDKVSDDPKFPNLKLHGYQARNRRFPYFATNVKTGKKVKMPKSLARQLFFKDMNDGKKVA
jgi:hypothetical protein